MRAMHAAPPHSEATTSWRCVGSSRASTRPRLLGSGAPRRLAHLASALDTKVAPQRSGEGPATLEPAALSSSDESSSSLWSYVSETTTSLASGLFTQFRLWPEDTSGVSPADQDVEAQLLQTGQALEEASRQTKEEHAKSVPPDISKFLQPTDVKTIRLMRIMSVLSALTYRMDRLTPAYLRRMLKLELVTTSHACELCVFERSKSAEEVIADGDGMAAAAAGPVDLLAPDFPSAFAPPASNIVALPPDLKFTAVGPPAAAADPTAPRRRRSPAEIVQAKITEAAEAAAAASAAAIAPLGSAAEHLYRATQGLVASTMDPPQDDRASHHHYSATKGVATPAGGAALAPAGGAAAGDPPTCPSDWFICDDVQRELRYFVIQGSDSLDHWRCNLTFDPVAFEDARLGVKVHRGVYDAALALYERFLPLVQEQLELSPFAKVCFTGHSIGGSLATVLMLMFRHRGVLPADRVAPVYTFGAPAVFCEGQMAAACSDASTTCCSSCSGSAAGAPATGLLAHLGLKERDVCNVIMTRDIVPRAFACDYSLVADILKTWGPSFRDHCCLTNQHRKLMYNFVGKMLVLQPSQALTFVWEPDHPMLPDGPGLYCLVEPYLVSTIMAKARREAAARQGLPLGKEVASLREAILELMDTPHPLETLYDAGAYGPLGSISRYHNPDHYTNALGAVVRDKQLKAADRLQLLGGGGGAAAGGLPGAGNGRGALPAGLMAAAPAPVAKQ